MVPQGGGTPSRSTSRLALPAVCLAYFMVILDTTIVNVALPALARDLHAGVEGLQWVVDGYLVVLAAVLLGGGALADRFGPRRVFQIGLALFVAASLACGLAPDIGALIGVRLIQGLGAGLAVPASLALLRAAYPESGARAKAIGIWGGVAGLAAAAGPLLGGLLVTALSWRLVFFVNVPIGLAAMALTQRFVPSPEPRGRALDPGGQVAAVLALGALTFAVIEAGRAALSPILAAAAVVAVAALAGFIWIERRVASPMLPLELFRGRGFSGGNAIGVLINLGFYGQLFVINLFFQQVRHYSALTTGLAMLPQLGVVAIGSALSGRFTARAGGPLPTLLIGLGVGAAGLLGLAPAVAVPGYLALVPPLVATGFGMSFTMPAATTTVMEGAPEERAGLAAGAVNAARQVGSVLGVALIGALAPTSRAPQARPEWAFGIAGAAFVAALVVSLAVLPRHERGIRLRP